MLKVATFDPSDAVGMNKLLSQYRLAPGAKILISQGFFGSKIVMPYEDGEPKSGPLLVIDMKEQINQLFEELGIITHSQKVLETMMAPLREKIAANEALLVITTANQARKPIEAELEQHRGTLASMESQHRMNAHEVSRLQMNVRLYKEQIHLLEEGTAGSSKR